MLCAELATFVLQKVTSSVLSFFPVLICSRMLSPVFLRYIEFLPSSKLKCVVCIFQREEDNVRLIRCPDPEIKFEA